MNHDSMFLGNIQFSQPRSYATPDEYMREQERLYLEHKAKKYAAKHKAESKATIEENLDKITESLAKTLDKGYVGSAGLNNVHISTTLADQMKAANLKPLESCDYNFYEDFSQGNGKYHLEVSVPGLVMEDLEVNMTNSLLTITLASTELPKNRRTLVRSMPEFTGAKFLITGCVITSAVVGQGILSIRLEKQPQVYEKDVIKLV